MKLDILSKFNKIDNKIKIVIVVFIVGIIFILIPTNGKTPKASKLDPQMDPAKIEKKLGDNLSRLVGVKKAIVQITYENDGEIDVITEDRVNNKIDTEEGKKTSQSTQIDKKPVFNSEKNIIIKERKLPTIKGVCVYFVGENSIEVQNKLYEATKNSLGVELYKITIVEMRN
jgi:stage III sporulation protein AG